jgi:tetratricopeptide (TPR) repeat protein
MNKLLTLLTAATLLAACGTENPQTEEANADAAKRQEMLTQIQDLHTQAFEEDVRMDRSVGHDLMKSYIAFANAFPKDSLTAEYLFEAADIGRELGRHQQAINLYQNVHDGYPSFKGRAEAAFLIGFIYQTGLNDRIMAEKHYNKVIELHPESEWAKAAKDALITVNMTDDQLLDFLKQSESAAQN